MRALLTGAALAAALACPAFAQPADQEPEETVSAAIQERYTPAYDACLESAEGQSTAGMIQCTAAETARQDKALNKAYAAAMASLNARQKVRLKAAQRAWIVFRDADCRSMTDEDWGTLSRITANVCVLHHTVQRTIDLENYPPD